jgi:hypothetical protein
LTVYVGEYGTSPFPGKFRYVTLSIEGRKMGYALDREGEFRVPAKLFDSLVKVRD